MTATIHPLTRPTPRANARGWQFTLASLVLLPGLCECAAADEALPPAAYQDSAVLVSRLDDGGASTSTEVTAVRTRLAAPAVPAGMLDGRTSNELAGVNYRWWKSNGRADVGVGVGTLGYVMPSPDGRADGPQTLAGAVPTLTVGMRYRVSEQAHLYADATGARGLGSNPNGAVYNTKVGAEWKPAKSRLGLEQGALGFHLDSGYKLSLKAKRGGLGLYLRSQF